MLTVLDVVQKSATFLEGKGVENARLNAEWLIGSALGIDRMKLYMQFDRPLGESELSDMRALVARRGKREPLQYILGTTPFHEITLKTDGRALIPRPETEQLVDLIISEIGSSESQMRILDLGTGTGAIALALAFALPQAELVAVDQSPAALELAQENAYFCGMQNRVKFVESNWLSALQDEVSFDVIVSNPPYLTEEEMASAEPEVRDHEPKDALFAGSAGLQDLNTIVEDSYPLLKEGGSLWLESGICHRAALVERCESTGYSEAQGLDDWSGRPRFIHAKK